MKSGALSGLKIVDLGHYIAGPYCASLLAGLGAEVIKVERPSVGDGARRLGPFPGDEPHLEKSGLFSYLNQGKKGVTLNLKTEMGKAIFCKLVAEADVLIENFEPRVMPSLGLEYETLRDIKPSLVMTSISNFGQSGPYRDYKGYEITLNALGGIQSEIGDPDREPVKLGGQQMQFQAGLVAAVATMGAVCYRDATGTGQHIDLAMVEIAASIMGYAATVYQFTGYHAVRNGIRPPNRGFHQVNTPPPNPRNPTVYPLAILPCKDGDVVIDVETPQQWLAFCDMMNRPELKEDPRFSTAMRGVHADELDAILTDYLKDKTQREFFEEASDWRIPVGIVQNTAQLFNDPQHRARGFFVPVKHPVLGEMEYPSRPFIMSETPWQQASCAPLLGEHNKEILVEHLGYSEKDLAAMTRDGVI